MKPEEITLLLYQALTKNIEDSIQAIKRKDFGKANQKLQRSNEIVERLGVGINYEAGVIADQLHVLYNYMSDKLFQANVRKDIETCEEVLKITNRIADGWIQSMASHKSGSKLNQAIKKKSSYEEQLDFNMENDKAGYKKSI
ncbi:flagellar export chaperone FliS [Desulfuribacillus alkaliarsenatis]|uniref:Flagellar export chaperone FliS n=2 Tax=Desulfuribacillus alkaliarsenatis TaxID=766136 RepID=A0A1E5G474_9FIRM|nr:flagellar export chaperone FliS [Desulfuribacillus alkaliarsenatis]